MTPPAMPVLRRTSLPPGEAGYRMPAEWEPHEATWLSWPHKEASWPGKLETVPTVFAAMARALAGGERVHINAAAALRPSAEACLRQAGVRMEQVRWFEIPTDDAWVRDHGPIFLVRESAGKRERVIVDWGYNAWGGKYPPFEQDDAVPSRIGEALSEPVWKEEMVLEGGSIEVNGRGTLLTTEACLLNPNRNPGLSRMEIEKKLRATLGVRQILWLGEGIAGDDTDGHVDDLARFAAPDTVLAAVEDDPEDINFRPLRENLARLRAMRDESRRALNIVTLPMPAPVIYQDQRLPASYLNFYIGNRAVLLPVFDCPADRKALAILQRVFSGREIVPIACTDMIWGLGACHCATQQQPL